MSYISRRKCQVNTSNIAIRLGLATTALLWLYVPSALGQIAPELEIAQRSGTEVSAEMNRLFVNPTSGNDATGNGSEQSPLKSITQALQQAKPNTTIVLAPGTYSAETGESFPLRLKPMIAIQGDSGNRGRGIVIQGGNDFLSRSSARQNAAIIGAERSSVIGVTLTNPHSRGYGLWIESTSMVVENNTFTGNGHDGISVVGDATPVIRDNHFVENGANGMTIYGTSRPEIRDNLFERTGFGINIGQKAAPLLIGNQIIQNRDGVVVQGNARPVLRNNQIERNEQNGVVAVGNARPDLGTSREPGGNVVRSNGGLDINATATKEIVPAFGNQVASDRTDGRLDLNGALASEPSAPVANNPPRPLPPRQNSSPVSPERNSTPSFPTPSALNPRTPPTPAAVSVPAPKPGSPIEIPVPAPQTASVSQPPVLPPTASTQIGNRPGDTLPTLLPVPDPNAPLGNTGVRVPEVVTSDNRTGEGPPSPPSHAAALGLRYRVIVEASNSSEQARVRRVVPDAFRTRINGRMVMQVGAFATQDKVDALMALLSRNGLRGIVLDIE